MLGLGLSCRYTRIGLGPSKNIFKCKPPTYKNCKVGPMLKINNFATFLLLIFKHNSG